MFVFFLVKYEGESDEQFNVSHYIKTNTVTILDT